MLLVLYHMARCPRQVTQVTCGTLSCYGEGAFGQVAIPGKPDFSLSISDFRSKKAWAVPKLVRPDVNFGIEF
jgi:hypothetical protein